MPAEQQGERVAKYCEEHGEYRGGDFPEGDCPKCLSPSRRWTLWRMTWAHTWHVGALPVRKDIEVVTVREETPDGP